MADEQQSGLDTRDSIYGRVESTPIFTESDNGTKRLYFKARQDHYRYNGGNSYTRLASTYPDVIAFDAAASHGHAQLAKGDWFIAQGRVREHVNPNTGVVEDQFVASRIGHDMARTDYEVNRTPERTAERDTQQREQGRASSLDSEEPALPERQLEPHVRAM